MKFGVCIPSHRDIMPVEAVMAVPRRAEELGYDSVWVNDHVIIPVEYLEHFSARYYDPYMILANAAARTRRVKLGTSVIVLPYRHPIVQAKMLTTLDALSGGRAIFGVGVGSVEPEYRALGVPFAERGALTDEALQVILELWTKEDPSFQGDHYAFSQVKFAPKPVQQPHIPIWVGGNSHAALRRAAQFGDAWHPNTADLEQLRSGIETLRQQWRRFNRDGEPPVKLRIGCRLYAQAQESSREPGQGNAEQVVEDLQGYDAIGIDYVVLDFAVGVTQEQWDLSLETFAREVMPQLEG